MSPPAARRLDWGQVRALLRVYLLISLRKMPVRTARGERAAGGLGSVLFVCGLYALFGLLLALAQTEQSSVFLAAFVVHLVSFFVVGSAALAEASEVLFNASEADVLGHRPVHAVTLLVAKAAAILAFTLLLASALQLCPMLGMGLVKGALPRVVLVHALGLVLSTVFAVGSVVCVYGLVARLLGRERLQRMVTAAQIVSTIVLLGGFQLVPRLVARDAGGDLAQHLQDSTWSWFLPPVWFAALDAWLGTSGADPRLAKLALVGLAATPIVVWLGLLRLPASGSSAATLTEETRRERPARELAAPSAGLVERLLAPWLRDPIERATFRLARAYLGRERAVKVRLASALAMYLVFPLVALFDPQRSGFLPLVLCWTSALVPLTVLEVLRTSAQPAAADLFLYAPLDGAAAVFHGTRKAALVFVQAPLFSYLALLAGWTSRAEPARLWLLAPALLAMPTLSLVSGLAGEYLPLSAPARTGQRTVQTSLTFAVMVPGGVLALLAWLAQAAGLLWLFVALELALIVPLHLALLRVVERRSRVPRRAGFSSADSA